MDFGSRIEEILSSLLSEPLLQDFVHLRPKKASKKNKELCDILIEDEPTAILVQLKAQDLNIAKANREEQRWVKKQLRKAESQTKGAIRNLSLSDLSFFNPTRGEINFKAGQLFAKHGIVIVDYNSSPFLIDDKLDNRTRQNIPIHYLTYNDFIVLCRQLKTLPDLITYLNERSKIPKWSTPLLGDEKNVYAYYLMNKAEFSYNVCRNSFLNSWETLTIKYREKYFKKIDEDKQADLFQEILNEMYEIDPMITQFEPNYEKRVSSIKDPNRVEISRSLNRIKLIYRREICKRLFKKLELADTNPLGFNYFSIASEDRKTLYFFLCSRHERHKRLEELRTFSTLLYDICKDIDRVVGVATENLHSDSGRSFDYILLEGIVREQDEKLLKKFKETFFKDMEYNQLYDFPDDKPQIII